MPKLITKENEVYQETGLKKYDTNIQGVYIYDLQKGWNWPNSILNGQVESRHEWFGQQSIFIEYSEYNNQEFFGQEEIYYNGLDELYTLDPNESDIPEETAVEE